MASEGYRIDLHYARLYRTAAGEHRTVGPICYKEHHHQHEHIRWYAERSAGLTHATEVHDYQDGDREHAEQNGVRYERVVGGCDGGDATGNRHRDRHDVVREECGRGQQTRSSAEVLLRHCVRAATVRIGEDRLPVGE